jgi:hypothetical protein
MVVDTISSNEQCILLDTAIAPYHQNLDNVGAIPLTEEWLIKFGFVKDADGSYLKFKMAIFLDKRFKYNLYLQTEETSSKWFEVGIKIKHVHQLQNLYFALTGEELTLQH